MPRKKAMELVVPDLWARTNSRFPSTCRKMKTGTVAAAKNAATMYGEASGESILPMRGMAAITA
jgi:hypothetical protein